MAKAIGIDLGTTNSVIAVMEGDSATVIASIDKAYSLLGKGSPSAEVKSLVTSRMGMIGKVYTSADVISRAVARSLKREVAA